MKPELENKLFEKYPKIFRQKDLPPNQSCMCFGIECGDGWYKILDVLCQAIQWKVDEDNRFQKFMRKDTHFSKVFAGWKIGWRRTWWWKGLPDRLKKYLQYRKPFEPYQVEAAQVKEKFAGLRFYTGGHSDEIQGMITIAELMSLQTCESCGKDGKLRGKGWVFTLCDKCDEERIRRKNENCNQ